MQLDVGVAFTEEVAGANTALPAGAPPNSGSVPFLYAKSLQSPQSLFRKRDDVSPALFHPLRCYSFGFAALTLTSESRVTRALMVIFDTSYSKKYQS